MIKKTVLKNQSDQKTQNHPQNPTHFIVTVHLYEPNRLNLMIFPSSI